MMHPRWFVLCLALAAELTGCSDDSQKVKDAAVDRAPDLSTKEAGPPDRSKVDALKIVPKIKSIIPDSGFADKSTPVTLIGENFKQGMTVYLEGEPFHGTVTVASSATATFTMPPNPYGPPYNPFTMTVGVRVSDVPSNLVKFRYLLATPMTQSLHGVILTAKVEAMRNLASPVIEGKLVAAPSDLGSTFEGEVGYGPVGSNASTDEKWRWFSVPFARKDGEYSVFGGSVRFPLEGDFDLAFRFSVDGGQYWIFADKDDADLSYSTAQAAKLKVSVPPPFYCDVSEDCAPYPIRTTCNVPKQTCVECLADADCSGNPSSFGPKCDAGQNMCFCTEDAECGKNPNGALCNNKPKGYCGCETEKNCLAPKTCVETPPDSEFFVCN